MLLLQLTTFVSVPPHRELVELDHFYLPSFTGTSEHTLIYTVKYVSIM